MRKGEGRKERRNEKRKRREEENDEGDGTPFNLHAT
jgi:hypothetical protein